MYVDDPRLGFYRKGIYERNEKGNNKRVGWTPVAIFMADGVMMARVGPEDTGQDLAGDKLNELWTYVADNAITEGTYREVAKLGKPWPDAHDPSKNKPIEAKFKLGDVTPSPEAFDKPSESPEQKLAREIAEARAGVSQYEKIDSDTMAGQALSLKNEITTLAGKLDKVREALVRPHVDAQAEVNGRLNPIIKDAKAQSATLLRAIGGWEDTKRAAQRAAEQAQARRDMEASKTREWNEAAPPGSIPEPIKTAPPIASNAPPPSSQVAAAVGRKASVKVSKFVTDIDVDKAFAQFRNEPGVRAVLIALAQKAVDAGLSVDGATVEERSVVR